MRIKNSFYNMAAVVVLYFVKIILSFAGKTCLIQIMGDEYNGIYALFGSIISMLSIAELGIGSAIIYNLYKPVKEKHIEEIKMIMNFYKQCYTLIAGVILLIGILITPLIKNIIGDLNIHDNIYILYYLFLLESVSSYAFSYKRSIIYANQKNYIISLCDIIGVVILQILQILTLIYTHNFILYLVVGIICKIAENIIIQICADRKYPYLKERVSGKLSHQIQRDIMEKVKGLLFHRIGSYIVFGTDNIIISRMVNIVAEGLYSNYLTIINPLSSILAQMISTLQASVGDLLIENNKEKNYSIYKRISFLNFWLYTVASICMFYLIQNFIMLWLGEKYLFDLSIVFVLSINFWQTGMRGALGTFKNASGIYYEDRYVPLVESIINIVVSISLTYLYGIIGVFIGTFISSLVIFLYSFPILVYRPLFDKGYLIYVKEMWSYIFGWILSFIGVHVAVKFYEYINIGNGYLSFGIKAVMVFVVVNLTVVLQYHKNEEFQYYKKLIITSIGCLRKK